MPITGKPVFDQDARASWFNHKSEISKPYYYRAYLSDYDVVTEIVPTERAAMFRFTFPESESSYVVIDAFDNVFMLIRARAAAPAFWGGTGHKLRL